MSNLSPAPGVKQTGYKAYVATALTAATAFAGHWILDEDPFTAKEAVQGVITGLVAAGIVGVPTFFVKNKPK